MNLTDASMIIVVLFIVAYLGLRLGMKFPSRGIQEKIYLETLIQRNTDRVWKCVDIVIDPRGGPFGSYLRMVLLESEMERVRLAYYTNDISKGDRVKLRRRTKQEEPTIWCNTLDRVMIPFVVS